MEIYKKTCAIEMYPPRTDAEDFKEKLEIYGEQFNKVIDDGFIATIPDNVLGFSLPSVVDLVNALDLNLKKDQIIVHLTAFHTKEKLMEILDFCREKNLMNLLVMTGDDMDEPYRLSGEELGSPEVENATSVELIKFIKNLDPEFTCGVVFNPYGTEDVELEKMKNKLAAGAAFVITQPILAKNETFDRLLQEYPTVPVLAGCWMSKNLDLLKGILGEVSVEDSSEDGYERMLRIRDMYPENGTYMSLLGFNTQYPKVVEHWGEFNT